MAEILTLNGNILTNNGNALTIDAPSPGPVSSVAKQVNFIDYDGTILHSYTEAEFNELSELPANPSHEGLTSQGWNWTMAQITAQLTAVPGGDIWVGQMYITESGDSEIDVTFDDSGFLSPYLTIAVNGTVEVDWGDDSPVETITGTSTATLKYCQHIYAATGSYTIKIAVESGTFAFYTDSDTFASTLSATDITSHANRKRIKTYSACVKALRIGEGAQVGLNAFVGLPQCKYLTIPNSVTSIGNYIFRDCTALASVTIPSGVTSIGASVFSGCRALRSAAIPSSVTSIGTYAFSNCGSLTSVTIPSSVTSIGTYAFSNCWCLISVTIPSGVTSIGTYTFNGCFSLVSVTIPSSVASIGTYAFTSCGSLVSVTIPNGVSSIENSVFSGCGSLVSVTIPSGVTSMGTYAFSNCFSLSSVTIPSSVTSIGNRAFYNCTGIEDFHFEALTPPTIGTDVFAGIVAGTVIYVPAASLEAYQTAANWSTYASYMVGE